MHRFYVEFISCCYDKLFNEKLLWVMNIFKSFQFLLAKYALVQKFCESHSPNCLTVAVAQDNSRENVLEIRTLKVSVIMY